MKISNRNPEPYIYVNPQGLNKACQTIQLRLQTDLSWLGKSFGRAFKIHREGGSEMLKEMTRPHSYAGNGEYYELMPNDSLKSFSFMAPISKGETLDYEQNTISQFIQRKVALIFWGNLKKIEDDYDNELFIEELIHDVLKSLKKISFIDNVRSVEDEDITEIFKPFTSDKFHQALFYPYFALRFELDLTYYLEDC